MVRYWLLGSIAGGFFLSGSVFAEPVTDHDPGGATTQIWGDPEDNEDADENWTWFGMGYERRARSRSVDDPVDDTKARGNHQRKDTR